MASNSKVCSTLMKPGTNRNIGPDQLLINMILVTDMNASKHDDNTNRKLLIKTGIYLVVNSSTSYLITLSRRAAICQSVAEV